MAAGQKYGFGRAKYCAASLKLRFQVA